MASSLSTLKLTDGAAGFSPLVVGAGAAPADGDAIAAGEVIAAGDPNDGVWVPVGFESA